MDALNPAPQKSHYLTPEEVSQAIKIAPQTLARWRSEGKGPDYIKLGGRVVYRWTDVREWVDGRKVACEFR